MWEGLSVGGFIRISEKWERTFMFIKGGHKLIKCSLRSTALETRILLKSENHPILLAQHPA